MTAGFADAARRSRHVFLRDMLLQASIGWYPHEHTALQRIRVNVDLAVDEGQDDGADTLGRVVSYEVVADTVRRIVGAGHVKLVETLAERLAEACLDDPRVRLARVQVEKLDVFPDAAAAGVAVERARR
jgi:dihydroneopterin aldolase